MVFAGKPKICAPGWWVICSKAVLVDRYAHMMALSRYREPKTGLAVIRLPRTATPEDVKALEDEA
jgi:hypothetical protein